MSFRFVYNAFFSFIGLCVLYSSYSYSQVEDIPVLYQGRFRPLEAYARLWLYDLYHSQHIQLQDQERFDQSTDSASDWLWRLHLTGFSLFQDSPTLWMSSAELKQLLNLPLKEQRFSYRTLQHALYENNQTSQDAFRLLITYHFLQSYLTSSTSQHDSWEINQLASGLWATWSGENIILTLMPEGKPWQYFQKGEKLTQIKRDQAQQFVHQHRQLVNELMTVIRHLRQLDDLQGFSLPLEKQMAATLKHLQAQHIQPKEIQQQLERQYPLTQRLHAAGSILKVLPGRYQPGEWFSLHALKTQVYHPQEDQLLKVGNFTLFSDEDFEAVRSAYLNWEQAMLIGQPALEHFQLLTSRLLQAYTPIEGQVYQEAQGKALSYPMLWQLKLERVFYTYPWMEIAIILYSLSLIGFLLSARLDHMFLKRSAISLFWSAFTLQTLLLGMRILILGRPPVSNMFETVMYVPWAACLISLTLYYTIFRHLLVPTIASLLSLILLIILRLTDLNSGLEPVQAVLDSQFWLIIHVLMVVGSYGVFLLGGLMGHAYLLSYLYHRQERLSTQWMIQFILQTFYMGTTLLVCGTILGGVWAAESWGRFWDWDPKESWAFISSCLYLLWIHAYRFHHIHAFGLALGSILGILSISFTWYGVNYVLGTGLHSYGFGSGGEFYYYLFLTAEFLFLSAALINKQAFRRFSASC